MSDLNQIRASYDAQTLTIYQAYSAAIAEPALRAGRFVPPFSMGRMTWIKPSFLWLMERSNWGQKAGQEQTLAVKIRRSGWDAALAMGVLTGYEAAIHRSFQAWREEFETARVHIQWDPERSIRGADLGINSIQVGLSRTVIERYVEEWTVEIEDLTPLVRKIHALLKAGQTDKAKKQLPSERVYPLPPKIGKRINLTAEN